MRVARFAAFSDGETGGNPAGVLICDELPDADSMQAIAAEVGYSKTAFAAPADGGWRVRYFAPAVEVDFCGHATIALGAALALRRGDGLFTLQLNRARITVEGSRSGSTTTAALQSPSTHSALAHLIRAPQGPGAVRTAGAGLLPAYFIAKSEQYMAGAGW